MIKVLFSPLSIRKDAIKQQRMKSSNSCRFFKETSNTLGLIKQILAILMNYTKLSEKSRGGEKESKVNIVILEGINNVNTASVLSKQSFALLPYGMPCKHDQRNLDDVIFCFSHRK